MIQKSSSRSTPLFTRLREHSATRPHQFHIPGHKCGRGMDPEFREFIGDNALSIDLINIAPLDDFHQPHGIIHQAEELAAAAFGSKQTFFSVQGTSTAIMAMIMAVCGPGEKLLLPRNAHRSVMAAMVLSGAIPVFLRPEVDVDLCIAHGVLLETVVDALQAQPDIRALLLTNPTYFGVCADVAAMARLVHDRGIPLLVDEAHGAHLYFHTELPPSAMQSGADAAATSMHKLCGSLTQSSVLNLQGDLISRDRVRTMLSLLTTTSTSYLLLSSLDAARRHMVVHGRELLDRALCLANYARTEINRIPGLYCFGQEKVGIRSSHYRFDPTKLCISVKDLGVSGLVIERMLRDQFQIEVELSDPHNILCVVTIADVASDIDHLLYALRAVSSSFAPTPTSRVRIPELPEHVLAISPRQALFAKTERVVTAEAAGQVAAEFVTVYPPGIPLLVPGEVITQDDIDYIRWHQRLGFPIQGPEDKSIAHLKVVSETADYGQSRLAL